MPQYMPPLVYRVAGMHADSLGSAGNNNHTQCSPETAAAAVQAPPETEFCCFVSMLHAEQVIPREGRRGPPLHNTDYTHIQRGAQNGNKNW